MNISIKGSAKEPHILTFGFRTTSLYLTHSLSLTLALTAGQDTCDFIATTKTGTCSSRCELSIELLLCSARFPDVVNLQQPSHKVPTTATENPLLHSMLHQNLPQMKNRQTSPPTPMMVTMAPSRRHQWFQHYRHCHRESLMICRRGQMVNESPRPSLTQTPGLSVVRPSVRTY